MPPIAFHPAHPQPFTLEQAMMLDIQILVAEVSRLQNSIAHLQRTQAELREYLAAENGEREIEEEKEDRPEGDRDGDDEHGGRGQVERIWSSIGSREGAGDDDGDGDAELRQALMENDQTIASQSERITLIKVALMTKVGKEGLAHYGIELSGDGAAQAQGRGRRIGPGEPDPNVGNRMQERVDVGQRGGNGGGRALDGGPAPREAEVGADEGLHL